MTSEANGALGSFPVFPVCDSGRSSPITLSQHFERSVFYYDETKAAWRLSKSFVTVVQDESGTELERRARTTDEPW